MTPTQTQQAIRIMQKHGQDGWIIEMRDTAKQYWNVTCPDWAWGSVIYRAVGPRKRVELKRGMEVKSHDQCVSLVVHDPGGGNRVSVFHNGFGGYPPVEEFTHYRWPNGNGTWLPIEGEPEIISMEGVE